MNNIVINLQAEKEADWWDEMNGEQKKNYS